jgi:zinc transport system substrate-binding protein
VVFVSILPQETFVREIAGESVDVEVMVRPGHSPATYEPMPRQMAALADARVYLAIGVPFERVWLARLRQINPEMRVVATQAGIERRRMVAHHHHEHEEEHELEAESGKHDEDAAGMMDPHIWLDPQLVKQQASSICAALCALVPEQAATYRQNLAAFQADLTRLDHELGEILAPLRGRAFMVFHPSWGYFAEAYGLRQIPVEIEGKDPGAKALAELIAEAREEEIRTIFIQKQFSTKVAQAVADAIEGRVVAIDPLAPDYAENLKRTARLLAEGIHE